MDEVTASENEPKYIDLHPLKKGKRVLVFLGDFFLTFILSLLLFHIGTYPLGRLIVNYNGQLTSLREAQTRRDKVLYDHELLFVRDGGNKGYEDFELNLTYTSEQFVHSFLDDTFSSYEVFRNYFLGVAGDNEAYVSFYHRLDEKYGFLEFQGNTVALKAEYKEEFAPAFDPQDTMSAKGQGDYEVFENKIFAQGYARLLDTLYENDLQSEGISYAENQKVVQEVLTNGRRLIVTCSLVTFLFSWILMHLVIPLFSSKRKTIGMMMMRVERIHKKTFDTLSIPMAYLNAFYSLAAYAFMPLFIPWGSTNFNELFALPILFPLALFALAFLLGSLGFLLFDGYNRTLGDFLCQSYCLSNEDFDILIRERGYKR